MQIDKARCAQEPIHTPGGIQPHGVLFVLDPHDLTVAGASDNCAGLLGRSSQALRGTPLSVVLGADAGRRLEQATRVGNFIDFNPLPIELQAAGRRQAFECIAHRSRGDVIVELEPCSAAESAVNVALLSVRKPVQRLREAADVDRLVEVAAAEVQHISGFERVMVYRFEEDWHGTIVAEKTSGGDVPPLYTGLQFPATDIPEQARRLYAANPIRLIANVRYVPARLVPATDGAGRPIDLSGAILRSVAPVHLEFLQNMGVGASMSISILIAGRLWGLIACHHRKPHRIGYERRTACTLVADMLAWQLASRGALSDLERRTRAREAVEHLRTLLRGHDDVGAGLASAAEPLLALFDAHGFISTIGGTLRRVGRTPSDDAAVDRIARALARDAPDGIAADHALGGIVAATAAGRVSGALLMSLVEDSREYLLVFRDEQVRTIDWGGDQRATVTERDGTLHPRTSFELCAQTVRGESARWSEHDRAAAVLVRQLILERCKAIERDVANRRLQYLATHDTLTLLPNRAALHDVLERSVEESRHGRSIFAILFVDLDHFKLYNDSFGHATGDRILQIAAARLQRSLRRHDSVARLGGDEFVVIARELTTENEAKRVAQKIVATLAEPIIFPNLPEIRITASVGIAVFPRDGDNAATLLHDADLAMYRAKERGRNGFAYNATNGLKPAAHERIFAERRVARGLENAEFVAYYQPIVDLPSGRINAMEALARWIHPSRGVLLPEEFIAVAERSGAIVKLGASMLRAACREAARWSRLYPRDAPHVSVNVSPRQFRDDEFVRLVADTLAETGLAAGALQLEVTENLLIEDQAHAIATLRTLAKSGVSIAIDDFGAGYSSLSYLKRLPVDVLKIDKSFITDLSGLPHDFAIVRAIIAMSRSLSLAVVAEGVENLNALDFLRAEGCDAVQGYAIARAVCETDAAAFIEHFDGAGFAAEVGSPA